MQVDILLQDTDMVLRRIAVIIVYIWVSNGHKTSFWYNGLVITSGYIWRWGRQCILKKLVEKTIYNFISRVISFYN